MTIPLPITLPPGYPVLEFVRIGPAVGEPFPNISLPDQHGRTVDLHAARAGRPAMVVFYRSAGW